jgi:N-acyl-D-amino-acid deacylase
VTTRILLRGGLVADGIGVTTRRADVLIEGQTIVSVGGADGGGGVGAVGGAGGSPGNCNVLDLAPGSVVCPGFIDAHAHAEGPLLDEGRVGGALAQGVTTLVVGQDGESWIGATENTARYLNRYFGPVNGALAPARPMSVADYRADVSGRLTQNVAVLASQGTIRHNVAGLSAGPLGPAERAAARGEVENALAEGAVGLSSGLDYLPSRFGRVEEITDMARPLAAAGRPYVSHLRGYGAAAGAGLAELAAVGQGAGVRVHASHLWGAPPVIEAGFRVADAAGVSITYDMYPYRRSSTILAVLLLPAELQARGPEQTLAALADPAQRDVLLAGEKFTDDYLRHLYLGCLPVGFAEFGGQSVLAAAAAADGGSQPAGKWVLDLLVRAELNVGAHLDRVSLADDHLAWLARDARQCAGSDGIYQGQHPHPRGYGAFSRLARYYLSDGPDTGYQQMARHLAANAAAVYGLRNRGRLAAGMAADICVIGPAGIADRATYRAPRAEATGVDLVIVNGTVAWRHGQPVRARLAGQFVS